MKENISFEREISVANVKSYRLIAMLNGYNYLSLHSISPYIFKCKKSLHCRVSLSPNIVKNQALLSAIKQPYRL